MLNMRTETTHTIDSSDLENFATELYGHQVEVVASEEWNNDECHDFNMDIEPLSKWNLQRWEDFKEDGTQSTGITRLILQDLVNEKIIPEGRYIVKVSW